jgi:pSer/pThr/pTyr-binding forkhead associated (FHA) protein
LSVDETLLVGRAAFLVALYLFLVILALLLRRELRARGTRATERAPADLLIVEPYETGLDPSERIPLLAVSTIGRADDNDVILGDSFLSATHARLTWNGRGWSLEDLNSSNGTRVNGKSVHKPVAVREGDTIEFGRVKAKLVPT